MPGVRLQETNMADDYETGTNPVLEQIQARIAELESLPGLTATDPDALVQAAAAPFLGCKPPSDLDAQIRSKSHKRVAFLRDDPIPTEYELPSIPGIRNQASCGQCWNFAGVGGAEMASLNTKGGDPTSTNWSEQAVVDCVSSGGCNGDWPSTTLNALKTIGTCDEAYDPYRASDSNGRCPVDKPHKIDDWGYVGDSSGVARTEDIQRAMLKYKCGIVVAVAVDNAWAAYRSGTFRGNYTGINHAVIIVGWRTEGTTTVWKVRNHWDRSYGMDGYIWQAEGSNLIGYGAAWVKVGDPAPVPPVPPIPPAPTGYKFVGDPVRYSMWGGTLTPTGKIVPANSLVASSKIEFSWRSISWLGLFRDIPKLLNDLNSVDVAGAVAIVKDFLAAVKAKDITAIASLWPRIQSLLDDPTWLVILADLKAVLADLGVKL